MLFDLSFLQPGALFPPQDEHEMHRLLLYERNKHIFEGHHVLVFEEQFKRIKRVIGNFDDVISYHVLANFQKLLSIKVADLLLGEPPKIIAGDPNSKEQISIDKIIENSDLINTAYENAIDVSRYGTGLFYIYKDTETNAGKIDVTQPAIWFPVVDPDNIKRVQFHVLAWKINKCTQLKVQIHSKGSYEERLYSFTGQQIGKLLNSPTVVQTGLSDFAVIPVHNLLTSDKIYGIDDYSDIESLVDELEVRLSQIAKILDKHAEPSMSGSSSMIETDPETGEHHLKMGSFFPVEEDDVEPKYITWDAQLEANFKMIDKIINILAVISEMGAIIFTTDWKAGNIPSGSAMRRLFINVLAKINRVKMRYDPALKKAIKLCSELGGNGIVNLSNTPISIQWQDGLPADPVEEANIMNTRTAGKATMSVRTAIKTYDGKSDEDTDTEIAEIDDDERKINPVNNLPTIDE